MLYFGNNLCRERSLTHRKKNPRAGRSLGGFLRRITRRDAPKHQPEGLERTPVASGVQVVAQHQDQVRARARTVTEVAMPILVELRVAQFVVENDGKVRVAFLYESLIGIPQVLETHGPEASPRADEEGLRKTDEIKGTFCLYICVSGQSCSDRLISRLKQSPNTASSLSFQGAKLSFRYAEDIKVECPLNLWRVPRLPIPNNSV